MKMGRLCLFVLLIIIADKCHCSIKSVAKPLSKLYHILKGNKLNAALGAGAIVSIGIRGYDLVAGSSEELDNGSLFPITLHFENEKFTFDRKQWIVDVVFVKLAETANVQSLEKICTGMKYTNLLVILTDNI
jgi:hypothetical protein